MKSMSSSKKAYTLAEARRKMEYFCSYQERCHQEVREKLRGMRMIPEAVDRITVHLIQNDFLNEERFAMQYALGKFHTKKWGRNRIAFELRKREISKYNIKKALQQLEDKEYAATFETLSLKKWQQLSAESSSEKKKRKLYDYLTYRGWESDLIYPRINELARNNK